MIEVNELDLDEVDTGIYYVYASGDGAHVTYVLNLDEQTMTRLPSENSKDRTTDGQVLQLNVQHLIKVGQRFRVNFADGAGVINSAKVRRISKKGHPTTRQGYDE